MKPGQRQSTILPKMQELKSNSVGNTENDKQRLRAIEVLSHAKAQETIKISKGYKSMQKDKTTVLANPNRFEYYLSEGFKFC